MEGGVTGPALFAPTSPTPPPPAFPLPALISNSVAQSVPQLIVKKMNPTVKKKKNQNLTKRNKQIILRGEVLDVQWYLLVQLLAVTGQRFFWFVCFFSPCLCRFPSPLLLLSLPVKN